MIARLAWYAGLLSIAAVTIAVQLDRQSAATPALATLTPEPVRGFAQARLAGRALQSGPPERALAEAELLVKRRPIPAETLALLAQAQSGAGQPDKALLTIQVAAQRGWREPVSQEALLRLALAAGDEVVASRRYTALFLQNSTEDALLEELGGQLFADAESAGSREMVELLGGSKRWPTAFLRRGARVLPPETFAAIVEEAAARGTSFDCEVLAQTASAIGGRSARAQKTLDEVARGACP